MTYIPLSVQLIIGYRVLVAFDLHSDCFGGQSLGLLVQTQKVGEFIFLFPLSVAYHVTLPKQFNVNIVVHIMICSETIHTIKY